MNAMALTAAVLLALVPMVLLRSAEMVAPVPEPTGGVAVTMGSTDGSREIELVGKGRFLVAHVTTVGDEASVLRERFAQAGLAGAITVVEAVDPAALPFIDNAVALAVIDGDAAPADREILRVLRPHGLARIKGPQGVRTITKPWPAAYGQWGHYQYDATFNEVTSDRAVGVPAGFQWVADAMDRSADQYSVRIADGYCVALERSDQWYITARDAFSGIELWSTPCVQTRGQVFNQYGFIVAEGRVYVHFIGEPFAKSYDLRNGKLLTTYDQGLELPAKWEDKKELRGILPMAELRRDLVLDGVLIQVHGPQIRALDFATGKLLWKETHPEGKGYDRPAAQHGTLVVTEGNAPGIDKPRKLLGYIRSYCIEAQAMIGINIADGRRIWRTPLAAPSYPMDNCVRDGRYFLSLASKISGDGQPYPDKKLPIPTLCVSMADGRLLWQRDMDWAGGHPPHLMATAKCVWQNSHAPGIGLAIDGTGEKILRNAQNPNRDMSFWGCSTTWMSESFFFSRLGVTVVETGQHRYNTAVRSACVFGSTPAAGLLYSTPHVCGCWGVVNGYNAVHSRDMKAMRTPWAGKRIYPGKAKPAPAKPSAQPASDEWPMYMRDSARTNWVDTELPKELKVAWTVAPPIHKAPEWLSGVWRRSIHRAGSVTALTAAEGVVAGAYMDLHTLFALDPSTGKQKWRRQLDSAIDSPPTIHQGALYVGTRGGWVWALNRDTGEVLWRLLATPHQSLMVVNGRLEAVWPLFGTIAMHEGHLFLTAGRHIELDEGIWWYALDPATGDVRSSGRLHDDDEWFIKGKSRTGAGHFVGINSPVAIKGDFAMLAPAAFKPSDGQLLRPWVDYTPSQYDHRNSYGTPVVVPGMYGLLYDGFASAGRQGPHCVYGGIGARMIAYRGDDFVGVNSGKSDARGGGGSAVARWFRKPPNGNEPAGRDFNQLSDMKWQRRPSMEPGDSGTSVLVAGGTVAAAGTFRRAGTVTLYSYEDGTPLSAAPVPDAVVFGGLCAARGSLYAACRDGSILAFR